jgi:hypothetical protein
LESISNGAAKNVVISINNGALNARKIGNCAMNDPRWWQLLDDACTCALYRLRDETSANTPLFSYPYGAMNFHRIGK